jgi:hypothetical protein
MLYDQIQRKGKSIESCESSTTSNEMVYIYAPVIVSYPFACLISIHVVIPDL